mmetsp:Transcript_11236/g.24995  ORF Transcript_11236/g.24995 Transcript_11236/m.24995 type:complete len:221 (+) Transcript_11236:612-1274(+)
MPSRCRLRATATGGVPDEQNIRTKIRHHPRLCHSVQPISRLSSFLRNKIALDDRVVTGKFRLSTDFDGRLQPLPSIHGSCRPCKALDHLIMREFPKVQAPGFHTLGPSQGTGGVPYLGTSPDDEAEGRRIGRQARLDHAAEELRNANGIFRVVKSSQHRIIGDSVCRNIRSAHALEPKHSTLCVSLLSPSLDRRCVAPLVGLETSGDHALKPLYHPLGVT